MCSHVMQNGNSDGCRIRTAGEEPARVELERLAKSEGVFLPDDHPLSPIALAITERSGIRDRDAALLSAMLGLGVATGNSSIVEFGGRRLNASLNALFLGEGILGAMQYVELPFSTLRRMRDADILLGRDEECAKKFAEGALAEVKKSSRHEMQMLESLHQELHLATNKDREEYVARAVATQAKFGDVADFGHRIAVGYDAAAKASLDARLRCGNAVRLLRPLIFMEGQAPDTAIDSARFSIGNSATCLDPFGLELASLVSYSHRLKEKIAARALASFEGNAAIVNGRPVVSPWFALISRGREGSVKKFLRDAVLSDGGMVARCLLVDLTCRPVHPAMYFPGADWMKNYEALIISLYQRLSEGEERCYQLSEEALSGYQKFCSEIQEIVFRSPSLSSQLEIWPRCVLKLALLLHIGSCSEPQQEISAECLGIASGILNRVGATGLLWVLHNGLLKSPEEVHFDGELQRLVSKVRMKGPLTRRELVRSYAGKRMADLEYVLEVAIQRGLVSDQRGLLSAEKSE